MAKSLAIILVIALMSGSCSSSKMSGAPAAVKEVGTSLQKHRENREIIAKDFAIASQSVHTAKLATAAFEKSKNLMDAFVVTSFGLAVERPQSTGLAGGGFLMFRHGPTGQVMAIDFRETAPAKAHPKLYLKDGIVDVKASVKGVLAAATPGFVAGVLQAHMLFGKTPVRELLQPVIALAREGFVVDAELALNLEENREALAKDPQALEIFFRNGKILKKGDLLVQENLAKTLELIAKNGRSGFYRGAVATALVEQQKAGGGLISQSDLADYQVKMREPVKTVLGDYQIYSMPPPSSGGSAAIEILNTLEALDFAKVPEGSGQHYHVLASVMQKAFADRARLMGDPDFYPVPYRRLATKKYAKAIAESFDSAKAKNSRELDSDLWDRIEGQSKESAQTTSFAMLDARGSMISSTQTVNGSFGAQVMVPGTGFFLNNEMNDFSIAAGVPNMYKAVGEKANEIRGRKRPLSSMTPTLVMKKWKPMLALGSPGGTRIISCVTNVLVERLLRDKNLYDSVSALRVHHQWYPDELYVESPGFSSAVTQELQALGHKVVPKEIRCRVSAVERSSEGLKAVVDPRGYGLPFGLGLGANDAAAKP